MCLISILAQIWSGKHAVYTDFDFLMKNTDITSIKLILIDI